MSVRAAPDQTIPGPPLPTRAGAIIVLFFGFLLVGLNCIADRGIFDMSLVPRLQALLLFLAVTVAALAVPGAARGLDWSVLRSPLVLWFGAYAAISCLSLLVAINATAGFTDVFKTLATLLVLCLSCLLLPAVPDWPRQLTKVVLPAAFIQGGIGIQQMVTQHGLGLHGRRAMESVDGLMSNVNLYANFLNLLLPLCLCGAVILRGAWRAAAAVAAVMLAAMVVLLQSRAAYVGLAGGTAVAVLAACGCSRQLGLSRGVRSAILAAFLAGVCGAVGFVATSGDDNPIAGRVRSIFAGAAAPADTPVAVPGEGGRLMIWGITARMIKDHPLLGVGAGNFTIRLHEYHGDDDADFSRITDNWLQPHNDFLWVWAEKGVFGLIAFAAIFWCALSSIRTILRGDPAADDAWLAVFALMGIVAYAITSCFDFPLERIDHQVYLAVYLAAVTVLRHAALRHAAVAGSARPVEAHAPGPFHGKAWWPLAVVSAVLVVLGLGVAYSVAAIRQERFMLLARQALHEQDWESAVGHARTAATPWKTLDPVATPVAFVEGMGHLRLGRIPAAIECLERARADNPNRMYTINNLGIIYASTGQFDKAIECFSLAAARYPDRVECFNNLAGCYIDTGRFAEAVALLDQIPQELRSEAVAANLARAREGLAAEAKSQPAAAAD